MNEMSTPASTMTSGAALGVLYRTLSPRRRAKALATIVLMLVGALAEVVSVGSVLPFLAVLTNPTKLDSIPVVGTLIAGLPAGTNLVALTATVFISLFVVSGLLRLLLAWVSQSLAFSIAYDFSLTAFSRLIRQPYPYYVQRHSGEALSQFEKLHYITFSTLLPALQALISTVVASLLIALLIVVNPKIALISASLLIGIYLLISLGVQAILRRNSEEGAHHSMLRVKRVQEAIGGIRDILLDRSQPAFERSFEQSADVYRRVATISSFIAQAPRLIIEMLGMVMIGAYAWSLADNPGGLVAAIPMLGALALGAQRLLPLLQQSYMGWSSFVSTRQNVLDVVALLSLDDRSPAFAQRRQSVPAFDRIRQGRFLLSKRRQGTSRD